MHYFHHAADPYAHLTLQVLADFQENYASTLKIHLISGPPEWAVPEKEALAAYALEDANRVARHYGLSGPGENAPEAAQIALAEARMAAELEAHADIGKLLDVSLDLWSGNAPITSKNTSSEQVKAYGDSLLSQYGHYLGATFYYGGEWHWGIDRLHYLEDRLHQLGLGPASQTHPLQKSISTFPAGSEIDFFLSFRSPYSYLALERTFAFADRTGVSVKIRPVLPMIMRGLPVPRAKRRYIIADAAREARHLGVPFGRIADPLGKAIERGYSLLRFAEENDRLREFCNSFMAGVWSRGIDASTDRGLAQIITSAGLDWQAARECVDNDDWRVQVEQNRKDMMELGLWGVPSYGVGKIGIWGQDRLWALEQVLSAPTADVQN
ncbi:2-hydroxychromene-2-carboxylate isomerase [Pseudovibrio japonicus]|uniref:2-hydroxychromene-2-carboxylate isomerase n=1 Tax=Pseudovibrio japonicus TaxID=366534 RepID=A0ABQ3EMW9_9HYPH|nr:DsbA family protein [Pseudovibrio japonicus]GHB47623.1 2-hydroxychromene-2-carboxylate isomerase [Pseudovibrio japonicus]